MKKIFKMLAVIPFVFIFLISSFFMGFKKEAVEAQSLPIMPIPFGTALLGPQITKIDVCCNGLEFTITPALQSDSNAADAVQDAKLIGTYIFPWTNMTPDPAIGFGYYQWWSVEPDSKVLGNKIPTGVCETVKSECESAESADWTVLEMGTNLISTVAGV